MTPNILCILNRDACKLYVPYSGIYARVCECQAYCLQISFTKLSIETDILLNDIELH